MDKQKSIGLIPVTGIALTILLFAVSSVNATTHYPQIDYIVGGVVRDFDNTPLANTGVFYFGTGANHGSTTTDANGLYTFTLSADTYEVSVAKFSYPAPGKQMVTVPPSRTDLDFTFPQRYFVAGRVRDSASTPIADALVVAFGTGINNSTQLTDAEGAYTLTLKADTYSISASKSGYSDSPTQSISVPPDHIDINFTLGSTMPSITPSPTITVTPIPTQTVTPTATFIFLPSIIRQYPAIATPTITPSPSPTVTPSSGNHAPIFPQPLPITAITQSEFDNNGRLIDAITTITITAASDADGDALAYEWSATNGSFLTVSTNGLVGQWRRVISAGRIQSGKVTIVVRDNRGGTATVSLNFS